MISRTNKFNFVLLWKLLLFKACVQLFFKLGQQYFFNYKVTEFVDLLAFLKSNKKTFSHYSLGFF